MNNSIYLIDKIENMKKYRRVCVEMKQREQNVECRTILYVDSFVGF